VKIIDAERMAGAWEAAAPASPYNVAVHRGSVLAKARQGARTIRPARRRPSAMGLS